MHAFEASLRETGDNNKFITLKYPYYKKIAEEERKMIPN